MSVIIDMCENRWLDSIMAELAKTKKDLEI